MLEILFPGIKEGQSTLLIILSCISVALWFLIAVARWSMFTKMGEKGWKAFVPFYGLYILYSKCWSTKAAWNCIMGIIVSALFEFGAFKTNGEIATILCSIGELMVAEVPTASAVLSPFIDFSCLFCTYEFPSVTR